MVIFHCYVSSPEDNPPILDLIGMIIGYHWISQTSPLSPASPAAIFCWPSHCLPPIDLWGFIHLAVLAALCSTTFFKDMLESVYMCLLKFGLTYIYIYSFIPNNHSLYHYPIISDYVLSYPIIIISCLPLHTPGLLQQTRTTFAVVGSGLEINGHFRYQNWRYLPYIRPIV